MFIDHLNGRTSKERLDCFHRQSPRVLSNFVGILVPHVVNSGRRNPEVHLIITTQIRGEFRGGGGGRNFHAVMYNPLEQVLSSTEQDMYRI